MVGITLLSKLLLGISLLSSGSLGAPTLEFVVDELQVSAPGNASEGLLVPRADNALYTLWEAIPGSQKVVVNTAKPFTIDRTKAGTWGLTYMYGCTGIIVSDPGFTVIGHLAQEGGGTNCKLTDPNAVDAFIEDKLLPALKNNKPTADTAALIVYAAAPAGSGNALQGVQQFTDSLTDDYELDGSKISSIRYSPRPGGPMANEPYGLAVVQWIPNGKGPAGELKVFFDQDAARRDSTFTS